MFSGWDKNQEPEKTRQMTYNIPSMPVGLHVPFHEFRYSQQIALSSTSTTSHWFSIWLVGGACVSRDVHTSGWALS